MTAVLEQTHKVALTLIDATGRYIESKDYSITYQMFSIASTDDFGNHSQNQNKAFLKVNYFLTGILDNSVAFALEDMSVAERFLADFNNNLMVLPDLDDMTMLECLQRKMQTIAGEHTVISKISLRDNVTGLTYHGFYEDDSSYSLPSQKDFCGEMSYWETPWWDRYDVLTFDNIAETQEEIDTHRNSVDVEQLAEPFNDIDESITEILDKVKAGIVVDDDGNITITPKEGKVVEMDQLRKKKAKWKPTIV
jgi:hypothetical protein